MSDHSWPSEEDQYNAEVFGWDGIIEPEWLNDLEEIAMLTMLDRQLPGDTSLPQYISGKNAKLVVQPMFFGTAPARDYGDNNPADPEQAGWDKFKEEKE